MPRLVRLYIRQVLIGFGLAAIFTALLIGFDVARLRHLVVHTADGPLAVGLLVLFNGIVFAGVQFGIAVMGLADRGPRGGGRRSRSQPVRVAVAVAPPKS